MLSLLNQLRRDEHGVILSSEIVVVGSLLVIGLITGTTCLQRSVDAELRDLGNAIGAMDQSYSFSGHRKSGSSGHCCAWTAGSSFHNCEEKADRCGDIVGCSMVVTSACSSCGDTQCTGCQMNVPCATCGGNDCGRGCGSTGAYSTSDGGVPGVRISESAGQFVPRQPMTDPLNLFSHGHDCPECPEDCPTAAMPQTPPCTDAGDIVIPDSVW